MVARDHYDPAPSTSSIDDLSPKGFRPVAFLRL